MKRVHSVPVLIALILLPVAGFAQQNNPAPQQNQTEAATVEPAQNATAVVDRSAGFEPGPYADSRWTSGQAAKSAPRKPKPDKNKPSEIKRPPIEGSMVGYIDNAIVGSQIRIRFDAAFDDNSPDRAEFFYAKCSCYRGLPPGPVDPNAPGPGPGIPSALNFQQVYFNVEYAPVRRFSLFTEVPVRWIQPQGFVQTPFNFAPFGNQAGLSDVQAGFKFAMLASYNHYLTFQFRTYFPSGDSSKGLGTNHYSIEPSVLYYQKLTDRMSVEAQLGDWHPIGGSAGIPITSSEGFAGDIFTYGIGPSYQLYRGERVRVTPVIEMFGWRVLSGFQTQPGGPVMQAGTEMSETNIVNIKAGVRTSIGPHNSFYIGFGQAVTHDLWYKHLVRLEYRYSF
jgi:Putative MetA-pathway of phenol degradation